MCHLCNSSRFDSDYNLLTIATRIQTPVTGGAHLLLTACTCNHRLCQHAPKITCSFLATRTIYWHTTVTRYGNSNNDLLLAACTCTWQQPPAMTFYLQHVNVTGSTHLLLLTARTCYMQQTPVMPCY